MKICDVTQFYSPRSGGVKRYLTEKIRFVQSSRPGDSHVLVVPGEKSGMVESPQSRIYTIRSPLISRRAQYRALLDLRAVDEIIEREQPDIIESSDPYQLGWKAIRSGRARRIPVVSYYHSHFPEAYLRRPSERLGRRISTALRSAAQAYVRHLYNQNEATLVASARLAALLTQWGVRNTRTVGLGVDLEIFNRDVKEANGRRELGIPEDPTLLLYVGRLAPEKNTQTLFEAFSLLTQRRDQQFHLLILGDGQQHELLRNLSVRNDRVTWLSYSTDSAKLAQYYRAADLFVHPGLDETFGLVALESQACGTPVVGILGSFMDDVIVHDQDSWARENTAPALANAIETMAGRYLPGMGSSAATLVAERYGWPRVFERLFGIYREVCANYASRHNACLIP